MQRCFAGWRQAIQDGHLAEPFELTHVDAHADLGLGDSGYVYLLTQVMHEALPARLHPREGETYLNSGNYLAFAASCRWLSSLTYVYNSGGGSDVMGYVMEDFDPRADCLHLAALSKSHIDILNGGGRPAPVGSGEPRVPFKMLRWDTGYQVEERFDVVCLARSPEFSRPRPTAFSTRSARASLMSRRGVADPIVNGVSTNVAGRSDTERQGRLRLGRLAPVVTDS